MPVDKPLIGRLTLAAALLAAIGLGAYVLLRLGELTRGQGHRAEHAAAQ